MSKIQERYTVWIQEAIYHGATDIYFIDDNNTARIAFNPFDDLVSFEDHSPKLKRAIKRNRMNSKKAPMINVSISIINWPDGFQERSIIPRFFKKLENLLASEFGFKDIEELKQARHIGKTYEDGFVSCYLLLSRAPEALGQGYHLEIVPQEGN